MNIDPKGLCLEDACVVEGSIGAYALWQWLIVGTVSTGAAVGTYNEYEDIKALSEKVQRSKTKTNTESVTSCPTIPPEDPCDKKLEDELVDRAGIDAHQEKRDFFGKKAQISRYDLCGCKNGQVVIKDHGCKGNKIYHDTGYYWK
ncbi:hypothetical protein QE94_004435 [Salmonella enterica subsp. enterica]|nr:hypothetical protein [Salmonella enterica subsp. enterica]